MNAYTPEQCECGHLAAAHSSAGLSPCVTWLCKCLRFEPVRVEEPAVEPVGDETEALCHDCGIPAIWCKRVSSDPAHCWRWDYQQFDTVASERAEALAHVAGLEAREAELRAAFEPTGCCYPGCETQARDDSICCDEHRYPTPNATDVCLYTGCGRRRLDEAPWCATHTRSAESSHELQALRRRIEAARAALADSGEAGS